MTTSKTLPSVPEAFRPLAQLLRRMNPDNRVYEGNSLEIITSGGRKRELLLEDIRRAKSFIHIEYFRFGNDKGGREVRDLLIQKASEGVEVRFLNNNWSGVVAIPNSYWKPLIDAGAEIIPFTHIRHGVYKWLYRIFHQQHRKVVVIDGEVAYTGGMNVADYYIVGTEQVGEWRDMHCRIEGPAVNELQQIFLRMWKRVTKETITDTKYFQGKPAGNKMVGIANREPHTSNEIMRRFYVHALDAAQDSIKLVNPYFAPTSSVIKALKRCAERGVKMDILMSSKYDIPLMPDVVIYNMKKLAKRGARIWRYRPGFHHSKIMMVDGKFCTVGSTNLDARSLRYDYEINAIIIDPETTHQLEERFMQDTQKCDLMTEESLKKSQNTWHKFKGWFGHLLTFVL